MIEKFKGNILQENPLIIQMPEVENKINKLIDENAKLREAIETLAHYLEMFNHDEYKVWTEINNILNSPPEGGNN